MKMGSSCSSHAFIHSFTRTMAQNRPMKHWSDSFFFSLAAATAPTSSRDGRPSGLLLFGRTASDGPTVSACVVGCDWSLSFVDFDWSACFGDFDWSACFSKFDWSVWDVVWLVWDVDWSACTGSCDSSLDISLVCESACCCLTVVTAHSQRWREFFQTVNTFGDEMLPPLSEILHKKQKIKRVKITSIVFGTIVLFTID